MVGLQSTVFKDKLKSKINGIVNYETWVPSPKLLAPAAEFFKVYQERAKAEGTDPLGYYLGGWGYAYFSCLASDPRRQTLKDEKLADYMHSHEFKTIMGDMKFGQMASGPSRRRCKCSITTSPMRRIWKPGEA